MKSFDEILKDAKLKSLIEEIQTMGIYKDIDDVWLGNDHAVIIFKGDTNDVILKDLQIIFKATIARIDGFKQFIYNV